MLPFELDPLHSGLVLAKPLHSVDEARVIALAQAKQLIITRKRDGYRAHIVVLPNGKITIYTRGLKDETARFPWIVEALQRRRHHFYLPALLDGELIVTPDDDPNSPDDFETLTKIMKQGSVTEAHNLQRSCGPVRFLLLDVPVWNGELKTDWSAENRLALARHVATATNGHDHVWPTLLPPPILSCSLTEARELVRKHKWEGLVLYHSQAVTRLRTDGNTAQPPRPDGCWKLKPKFEDDFIADRWQYGTGRNKARMGKLFLAQYDSQGGLQRCGEVGLGFSDEEREWFAREAKYPLVIQVEFQKRFRKTGSLRSPSYIRVRYDKQPAECISNGQGL